MSASTFRNNDNPMVDINITPLIDVMLALLLIFMISAPLLTKKIDLPMGKGTDAQPRTVEMRLTAEGQVIYNDAVLQPLELEAQLLSWGAQPEKPMLQLRPDGAATHQHVVQLLAQARNAGVDSISVETPR